MTLLEKYILENSSPQSDEMAALERATFERAVNPHMVSGHLQGKLLEFITRMLAPRNVLEIGTFTGYSTLSVAAGLSEGAIIDTVEANEELQDISGEFFSRSPHRMKIHAHVGSALAVAPSLGKVFDLVFIDGGKKEYPDYYRMLMGDGRFAKSGPLLKSGSYILADNILWYGKVANTASVDCDTQAIREFNAIVRNDPRVECLLLPLRDGISLIRVK